MMNRLMKLVMYSATAILVAGIAYSTIYAGVGKWRFEQGLATWREAFYQDVKESAMLEKSAQEPPIGRYTMAVVDGGSRLAILDTREGFLVLANTSRSGLDVQEEIKHEIIMSMVRPLLDSLGQSDSLLSSTDSLRASVLMYFGDQIGWQISRNGDGKWRQ